MKRLAGALAVQFKVAHEMEERIRKALELLNVAL